MTSVKYEHKIFDCTSNISKAYAEIMHHLLFINNQFHNFCVLYDEIDDYAYDQHMSCI